MKAVDTKAGGMRTGDMKAEGMKVVDMTVVGIEADNNGHNPHGTVPPKG